eukprot:CAMPEP_0184860998 /NCGR_PEP_ID=MMETSP0580-20130426/5784_1 /TAXON_ID=1118495 /ORGANISM="Dactyliosolen fragilissimus" /LENGTH=943 /DNA_ID=CAMNT_0027358319 /DNA_START=360 /DNA_END=3191 /DNA_ORIENTATION=+
MRRFLRCLEDDEAKSPYVARSALNLGSSTSNGDSTTSFQTPPLFQRRSPPSHIILCQELLERESLVKNGGTPLEFSLYEDESLCEDWATPHSSLMEIFASSIIAHVGSKYGMTYRHNCAKTKSNNKDAEEISDLDWTTVQQEFPPSGLVLDDSLLSNENQILGYCKGCLAGFNEDAFIQRSASGDISHITHHCLLYPGTGISPVAPSGEIDLVAISEQRALARQAPLATATPTIKDRLRLMAVNYRRSYPVSPMNNEAGNLVEETDGAVVFIDDGSLVMSDLQYNKHIPDSVKTIDILTNAVCVSSRLPSGESCLDHAQHVTDMLQTMYPRAIVRFDIVTSTAASYSRMILAKYLICPPGTTSCLFPSIAKEEDSFAVIAESPQRANTFHWFDVLSDEEDNIQVAYVKASPNIIGGSTAASGGSSRFENNKSDKDEKSDNKSNPSDLGKGIEVFNNIKDYRDECTDLRGRLGSWEQDYHYENLMGDNAAEIHGSTHGGIHQERYHAVSAAFKPKGKGRMLESEPEPNTDTDTDVDVEGGVEFKGKSNVSWKEPMDECELDLLNLDGLCEVMAAMKLHVIQFVGDEYTEEMVRSFWKLLKLPDADILGKESLQPGSNGPPVYRKTVHCPKENIEFDIVFTPNDKLVNTHRPDPIPVEQPRYNPNIPKPNIVTHTNTHGQWLGNGSGGNWVGNGGSNNWARSNYNGRGNPGPVAFNDNCQCTPWVPQYQSIMPTQRQVVVAGMSPNMSYEEWCRQFDQFGQGVHNYGRPNDVVFMRSAVTPHGSCGCMNCGGGYRQRKLQLRQQSQRITKNNIMGDEDLQRANDYMIKTIDEYRRRTRQFDNASYDPLSSKAPKIHFFDVTHMTNTHPHVLETLEKGEEHGRKLCQRRGLQGLQSAPMYDAWNDMFYSQLRDLAAAETKRNFMTEKGLVEPTSSSQGSIYSYGHF